MATMNRLTRAWATNEKGKAINYVAPPVDDEKTQFLVWQKLGQLEDIEEELGIDLITYFEIKKSKIVFMKEEYPNNEIKNDISEMVVRSSQNGIDVCYKGFINIPECDISLHFKDYGKTWALTKEELRNE